MSGGWLKLSERSRQALRVLFVSLALTLVVVSAPGFHNVESAVYDLRRVLWKAWTPQKNLDPRIVLVSLSDSTYRTGWSDERTLELLQNLEARGARLSVFFGSGAFADLEAVRASLPNNVKILEESESEDQELLFVKTEESSRSSLLDPDGILRSIPPEHPSLGFAEQLLESISVNPPSKSKDRFFIDYLEAPQFALRGEGLGVGLPLVATPAEALEKQLETADEDFDLSGKLILFERFQTGATRVGELDTPETALWPFQLYACILQTYIDDADVERLSTWIWIPLLLTLMAVNVVTLSGRSPWKLATHGCLRFGLLVAVSTLLLPLGLEAPVATILTGVFLSTLCLLLLEFRRLGSALRSFGGIEDVDSVSEERVASILFTEMPKYLIRLEREEAAELLVRRREYNVLVESIAARYHGRVLDYQGDAQMIGFGLGENDGTDHALEAVAAAVEIVETVPQLQESWETSPSSLAVHAGVCSGEVALGHVLAAGKQDLAAIGDTTNTAARIMGAAIKFDQSVLVSESTVDLAGEALQADFYKAVELKGKAEPVQVHTVASISSTWKNLNSLVKKKGSPGQGRLRYGRARRMELGLNLVFCALAFWTLVFARSLDIATIPEFKIYDFLHVHLAKTAADPRIVIVGIDEESVSEEHLGTFPWPRGTYAKAIENLSRSGCRGVFFDLLFRKSSQTDILGDWELVESVQTEPRVVLAATFEQDSNLRLEIPKLLPGFDVEKLNRNYQLGLIHRRDDEDRVLRSGLLAVRREGVLFPSASVALLVQPEESLGVSKEGIDISSFPVESEVTGPRPFEILIRFGPPATAPGRGPEANSYRYVPFWRLLDQDDPIYSEIEGCYLLVGQVVRSGSSASVDVVETPVGPIKGVEVHARTLDSLLNDNYMRRVGDELTITWMLLIGLLSAGLTAVTRSPRKYLPRVALLCLAPLAFSCLCFSLGYWVEVLFPALSALVLMAVVSVTRYVLTFKAMGRFIPKEAAHELLRSHSIQDRRLEATVLLTDIRGYTTLSEGRRAIEMLDLLNEYHKRTVACYERLGGQALTYQGDAQIVVFGVFGKAVKPARDAVAAALELQMICAELRQEWGIESRSEFDVGAGLCTGEIEVGVLGGEKQRQISVVGETVRKSHKIQALSGSLDAPVILDEETYQACRDEVEVKSLGRVQPKGMARKIRLFKALCVIDANGESKSEPKGS